MMGRRRRVKYGSVKFESPKTGVLYVCTLNLPKITWIWESGRLIGFGPKDILRFTIVDVARPIQ